MKLSEQIQQADQLINENKIEAAKQLLIDLNQTYTDHVEILHRLGFLYFCIQDYEKAEQLITQAIRVEPQIAKLHNHLGLIYSAQQRYRLAKDQFHQAIDLDSESAEVHNNYGLLLYKMGDYEKATEKFYFALKLEPSYLEAMYNLALALIASDRITDAIASLMAIIDTSNRHNQSNQPYLKSHFLLGKLLVQREFYADAEQHFKQLIEQSKDSIEIMINIVSCWLTHQRYKEAKKYCEMILAQDSEHVETYYNLAVIETHLGETERAIEHYHFVLHRKPDDFPALNNLAVLYLQKQNIEAAKYYFEQALRVNPDDEAIRYTLRAISGEQITDGAPKEYIRHLFDSYADHFEEHLTGGLAYQVPTNLKNCIEETLQQEKKWYQFWMRRKFNKPGHWEILDLGCGTGLCGELFKPWASHIVGVDLSPKMLVLAKQKNCYDELIEQENIDYLAPQKEIFDLIIAADVFVYQGSLETVLSSCYQCLKAKGLLAFTTEITDGDQFKMQPSGRFAHSMRYIKKLAKEIGFTVVKQHTAPSRRQGETMLEGCYTILQKP